MAAASRSTPSSSRGPTRTSAIVVPPLPTAGSLVPTLPSAIGGNLPVTIDGSVTVEGNVAIPANFPNSWEVAFYDPVEWRDKKQEATPRYRAAIRSSSIGLYAFTADIAIPPGSRTVYAIQVRQTDGRQIGISPTTEVTIPGQLRFALPITITGIDEPQARTPSPASGVRPERTRTGEGLAGARQATQPAQRRSSRGLATARR